MKRYVRVEIEVDDDNERRCDDFCRHLAGARDICDRFDRKEAYGTRLKHDGTSRPIRCRACLAADRAALEVKP